LADQDRQHDALPELTIKLSGLSTGRSAVDPVNSTASATSKVFGPRVSALVISQQMRADDDQEEHIQKRTATGELHQNVAFHPETPLQDAACPYLTYSPPFRPRYLASLAKLAKEEACGGEEVGESLLKLEAHDAQVGAESAECRAKDTLVSLGASLTSPEGCIRSFITETKPQTTIRAHSFRCFVFLCFSVSELVLCTLLRIPKGASFSAIDRTTKLTGRFYRKRTQQSSITCSCMSHEDSCKSQQKLSLPAQMILVCHQDRSIKSELGLGRLHKWVLFEKEVVGVKQVGFYFLMKYFKSHH
jgi:hypothetical protein